MALSRFSSAIVGREMTDKFGNRDPELTYSKIERERLPEYLTLLGASFPNFHVTSNYLKWLYYENPNGKVVGFDALDNNQVIAHYACIPIQINGFKGRSLLSLNTATHPDYQGRGLFRLLATETYKSIEREYACVVGVANAKSFGGFVRHLGFEHLGNLELRWGEISRKKIGSRCFGLEELDWRARSPIAPLRLKKLNNGRYQFTSRPYGPLIHIRSVVNTCTETKESTHDSKRRHIPLGNYGFTLDWNRGKKPHLFLPARFKPSPLALIFKPLEEKDSSKLDSWSFPDFDAL